MGRACPEPRRRGGARPGAGAPRGNTNALQTGAYARRTRNALKLIMAIPTLNTYYQTLRARTGPRAHQRQRNLIDAAQHVIATHPNLAAELEALIVASLHPRARRRRAYDAILNHLAAPSLPSDPLRRALKHTAWLTRHDTALHILLTNHVLTDLEPKLEFLARKTIKQSNPETQEEAASGTLPKPPSLDRPS